MRISERWLREFVDPPASAVELGNRLTLAGLEVVSLDPALPDFDGVVVAEVTAIEPHSAADKLKVCRVSTGAGRTSQVVCGAPNVRTGMHAALVRAGGHLPGGTPIQVSKLRGIESQGMLCSGRELGLTDDHSGLLELPPNTRVGQSLGEVLGGPDTILDIEITPNRGDALSVLGIARELGTLFDLEVQLPDTASVPVTTDAQLALRLSAADGCVAFCGRVIRGLDAHTETPLWMRERLRRAGLRSVSLLVDVTQYVMLEFGQPLHAYDLDKLHGGLQVRWASAGEQLALLNGSTVHLQPDMLVIADDSAPVGLAGIMGGQATAVGANTRAVFLESACFLPTTVQGRARRLGLVTDAGYRFERGVDSEGQRRALERATHLLLELAGGHTGPVTQAQGTVRKLAPLRLRSQRLAQLLGIEVPPVESLRILQRLGFQPAKAANGWQVSPPSWRYDIEIEEDLVEEIGRIYGYDKIPVQPQVAAAAIAPLPERLLPVARLREVLTGRGYQEVITYSFVDSGVQKHLTGMSGIPLANPITDQMTELRVSLWPGLLQALVYNLHRQQERVRIFEIGSKYLPQAHVIKEQLSLAGLISGPQFPLQWGEPSRPCDFFDLRSDIDALLSADGQLSSLRVEPARHAGLHPGQSAQLWLGEVELGWIGALRPELMHDHDVQQPTLLFELALEPLLKVPLPKVIPVARYPSIQRDLAVVVPEQVTAAQLMTVVRQASGGTLGDLSIFDIYRGTGIDSGRKSIAFRLILQDYSRTLTDSDADRLVAEVRGRLERVLGATIRD
ncbi:MAG: phenylalanine--tRNA ligase subunit beta [Gammaproteobacteria bacterium]